MWSKRLCKFKILHMYILTSHVARVGLQTAHSPANIDAKPCGRTSLRSLLASHSGSRRTEIVTCEPLLSVTAVAPKVPSRKL